MQPLPLLLLLPLLLPRGRTSSDTDWLGGGSHRCVQEASCWQMGSARLPCQLSCKNGHQQVEPCGSCWQQEKSCSTAASTQAPHAPCRCLKEGWLLCAANGGVASAGGRAADDRPSDPRFGPGASCTTAPCGSCPSQTLQQQNLSACLSVLLLPCDLPAARPVSLSVPPNHLLGLVSCPRRACAGPGWPLTDDSTP